MDAADVDAVVALCAKHDVDVLCSFLPVEFNPHTLQAALKAGVHHLDASTTLSIPHPTDPFNQSGTVLGQDELALSGEFEKIGKLGLMGFGVEPAWPTGTAATPPTTSSTRSTRSACATAPTSRSPASPASASASPSG